MNENTKLKAVVLDIVDPADIAKTINLYLERHPAIQDVVSVSNFVTARPATVTRAIHNPNAPQFEPVLSVLLLCRVRIEPAQC